MKNKVDIPDEDQENILENAAAREIVHEIMNFGVNQRQIVQIINLLACAFAR